MRLVCEHIFDEMGELNDNVEMLDMLADLEAECKKVNVYEYFNDIATVYVDKDRYYVFNTQAVDEDSDDINAYITEFRDKEDVIYYLIDNTFAEDYKYLDKVI